jgi:hypothetical protein
VDDNKSKSVKWDKCNICGCKEPPNLVATDVHVTWGCKVVDDKIVRSKTPKAIVEDVSTSYLVCSNPKCGATIADNVETMDDFKVVRSTGGIVDGGRIRDRK